MLHVAPGSVYRNTTGFPYVVTFIWCPVELPLCKNEGITPSRLFAHYGD